MVKSIMIIVGATIFAFFLVNKVFPEPKFSDPLGQISFATSVERPFLAWKGYKEAIAKDSFNVRYHYGLLMAEYNVLNSKTENEEFHLWNYTDSRDHYYDLCLKDSRKLNDIGNFGLAMKSVLQGDMNDANKHFELIHDTVLPIVNYLKAEIALSKDSWLEAEHLFKKEIALKGDTSEAYHSLGLLYYTENRLKDFGALAAKSNSRQFLPAQQLREFYFHRGMVFSYLGEVLIYMYGDAKGLMVFAALLLVLIWVNYLRRINIFKPEKWNKLAIIFVLGMVFAPLVYPIDDAWRTLSNTSFTTSLDKNFLYCIAGIGGVEELLKIIPLFIMLRFFKVINEPIDYIIFASVSALGFSFAENIIYFKTASLGTMMARGLLSTTLHMAMTSLIAYSLLMSRYRKNINPILAFLISYIIASFIHGLYDFSIFINASGLALLFIGLPCVFIWGIILNTALNQSNMATDESEVDPDKTASFLHYAFAAALILVFLAQGLWYGPTVTLRNTPAAILFCIPLLLIISARLSHFEIIPGYWLPISYRGFAILPGWYEILGRRLVISSFRAGSILEDMPRITGTTGHDMKVEGERWHLMELDTPIDMDGDHYTHAVIGAKDDGEPVGLTAKVVSYFFLVPFDLNTEAKNYDKRDFEFIDWALVSPYKEPKVRLQEPELGTGNNLDDNV